VPVNRRCPWAFGFFAVLLVVAGLSGCGATSLGSAKPPTPGGPRIANLQFTPDRVRAGDSTTMSFYLEVATADVREGFVLERGIEQFQLYTSLRETRIDLSQYFGQVAALIEVPMSWSQPGLRFLEVYVVTKTGAQSNRIAGRITVD
jgi:hypothetical protein